jgi:hypothetical protein
LVSTSKRANISNIDGNAANFDWRKHSIHNDSSSSSFSFEYVIPLCIANHTELCYIDFKKTMGLWKSEKGLESLEVTKNSFISVKYSKNSP